MGSSFPFFACLFERLQDTSLTCPSHSVLLLLLSASSLFKLLIGGHTIAIPLSSKPSRGGRQLGDEPFLFLPQPLLISPLVSLNTV